MTSKNELHTIGNNYTPIKRIEYNPELIKRLNEEAAQREKERLEGKVERGSVETRVQTDSNEDTSFSFLGGEYGLNVLERYNAFVESDYEDSETLKVFSFADDVVKGSNPYALVILNKILKNDGKWTAKPSDLEKCLKEGRLNLSGFYEDSALVLRSVSNPNQYLAKSIANQVKARGNLEYPLMIPLAGLDLIKDINAPNGLKFSLTDSAELIHAPQLVHDNNRKRFNECDEKGLPIFEEDGTRTLYTRSDGLSRDYLGGPVWFSGVGRLEYSDGDGRVVVVSAEGTRSQTDKGGVTR